MLSLIAAAAVFIIIIALAMIKTVNLTNSGPGPDPLAAAGRIPAPIPSSYPGPRKDYDEFLAWVGASTGAHGTCHNIGASFHATVVAHCVYAHGLAATTIYYYLFPGQIALAGGFSNLLQAEGVRKKFSCTSEGRFSEFIAQCESNTIAYAPGSASVAEYVNNANDPVIVSTSSQLLTMTVMVGTNEDDLLSYWKQVKSAVNAPEPDPSTAQGIAFKMLLSFGFSPQGVQYSCLNNIWARQSGWRYNAQSASGAYGIPQSLPGSKMASAGADWQTNPATQIKWGLGYIKDTYGSPCQAWSFWQAHGWY